MLFKIDKRCLLDGGTFFCGFLKSAKEQQRDDHIQNMDIPFPYDHIDVILPHVERNCYIFFLFFCKYRVIQHKYGFFLVFLGQISGQRRKGQRPISERSMVNISERSVVNIGKSVRYGHYRRQIKGVWAGFFSIKSCLRISSLRSDILNRYTQYTYQSFLYGRKRTHSRCAAFIFYFGVRFMVKLL